MKDTFGDWEYLTLGDIAIADSGYTFKSADFLPEELTKKGLPVVRMSDLKNGMVRIEGAARVCTQAVQKAEKFALSPNDFLFGMSGSLGNFAVVRESDLPAFLNQRVGRLRARDGYCQRFISYLYLSDACQAAIREMATGAAQLNISIGDVRALVVKVPSLQEQQKISSILTAVDEKLDVVARQIEATQTLKQGLMQSLFSRGAGTQDGNGCWVPYTEFKDSELGAIPTLWSVKEIGEALSVVERPIKMADDQLYRRVTVRRRHGGVDLRDELPGAGIKVKNQFLLETGDFLISERQIVHGACGIVPEHLAGALVSNEYLVLQAREGFDVTYFNYLVQLLKYAKLFLVCSQGVDIEKFLFKPKDWLKKRIPVPPLAEQQRIAEILATIEEKTNALQSKQSEYQALKRGLMQKLLTGEWRVKIDTPTSAA
ncbi:hypothetical protein AX279_10890 [Pseudomonas sp. J237]|nr:MULTISPECIES: restriction endonuclease subunit S [Pseudomonas]OEO25921.1 hypothetical protein AX279_10890 [Pseudomonas sp. J237]